MNQNKHEKIYVIGFPKSGNTWLVRLLSEVLDCDAGNGMNGNDSIEIASRKGNNNYKILKTHFLPAEQKKIDKEIKRIIYIKRDFKDVIVSAFLYINKTKEDEIKLLNFRELLRSSPNKTIIYLINRYKLWKTIYWLLNKWNDKIGNWKTNCKSWKDFHKKHKEIKIYFTTYEKLLENTKKELKGILKTLDIKTPNEEIILRAINKESFENKKKELTNLTESHRIPFGKDFNVKFLRKGKKGDWKNYLNKKMLLTINKELNNSKKIKLIFPINIIFFIEKILNITKAYIKKNNTIAFLTWLAKGKPTPPPHIVKQKSIKKIAKQYKIKTFIETGTYEGKMISAMKNNFNLIYSIEIDKNLYTKAVNKFNNIKKIKIIKGDSGIEIKKLLKNINNKCLFWLDGHYSAGITSKGDLNTPIVNELINILNHKIKGHIILIDDAR